MLKELRYEISPTIQNDQLNALFASAWPNHEWTDFSYLRKASLGHICCYQDKDLVGFVNVAWDGNRHAFILDTTVHQRHQRRGLGRSLVAKAIQLAKDNNVEWVHVDFEEALEGFYRSCGFKPTAAGLVQVADPATTRKE